jgi:hypothetical protein
LLNAAKAADGSTLLQAGVTIAQNLGGEAGVLARQIVSVGSAVASGFAVGGPYGAAVGAVVGLAGILGTIFEGYQGVYPVNPTQGEQKLYELQVQWYTNIPKNKGAEFQNPQGWTLYDYLVRAHPPNTTTRGQDLYNLKGYGTPLGLKGPKSVWGHVRSSDGTGSDPLFLNTYASPADYLARGGVGGDGYQHVALQGLCTPVFWFWGQAAEIQDCLLNEWFGVSPFSLATYKQYAVNDIFPTSDRSAADIFASAVARAPDPLYFDANLYAVQGSPMTAQYEHTVFFNPAGLIAVSTVLGLLQVGASTRAIVSELLFQQKVLHDTDGSIPPLVQMLVDDYTKLGKAEDAAKKTPLTSKKQPTMRDVVSSASPSVTPFAASPSTATTSSVAPYLAAGGGAVALFAVIRKLKMR